MSSPTRDEQSRSSFRASWTIRWYSQKTALSCPPAISTVNRSRMLRTSSRLRSPDSEGSSRGGSTG